MNIRKVLKEHYRLEAPMQIVHADLVSVREDIARYEKMHAEELPSYGVASLVTEGRAGGRHSDPTPLMMLRTQAARREIERALQPLYAEAARLAAEIDGWQRAHRQLQRAIDALPEEHRQVILLRYKQGATLQSIAMNIYNSVEPSTAHYHVGRAELALCEVLPGYTCEAKCVTNRPRRTKASVAAAVA